jgi:hypothetical protein
MDHESPGELAKVCVGETAPDIHPLLLLTYRILESNHIPMYPGFPPCESVETLLQVNYFTWFCVPYLSGHRGNDYLQSGRSFSSLILMFLGSDKLCCVVIVTQVLYSCSRVSLINPMRR